ncbi:MAG: hypothetical protein QGF00_37420, partial [Planctomycetota bacterium]|nr:hypothetical protein [Planctomycetota bacterium]
QMPASSRELFRNYMIRIGFGLDTAYKKRRQTRTIGPFYIMGDVEQLPATRWGGCVPVARVA